MNVATKELCQELYELSGWQNDPEDTAIYINDSKAKTWLFPKYTLGYLLRKLPNDNYYKLIIQPLQNWDLKTNITNRAYWFRNAQGDRLTENCYTPEDAACKLAIELFKQGILTK